MIELYETHPFNVFVTKEGERPFTSPYRPEMDTTKVLGDYIQPRYLQIMGVLRWAI